jgi:cysteine desulfurase
MGVMAGLPMTPRRIYLDHAATTAVRGEVLEAMRPFFAERFGNASSLHAEGKAARKALEEARESIRKVAGARGFDLVFTSGGTEADNWALLGSLLGASGGSRRGKGLRGHVVTSAIEHPAVIHQLPLLEALGVEVTLIDPDREGRVDPARIDAALRPDTVLVSLMWANNETGRLEPILDAGRLARKRGALFHTDAVQILGKLPLSLDDLPVDLVTVSSHKIFGPKGIAGLFVRKGTPFEPLLRGGSQEMGLRAGTENVPLAVGFARAVELAEAEREEVMPKLGRVRDRLRAGIRQRFPRAVFNTPETEVLPTLLNVSFPGVEGESLIQLLDWLGIAASTGSACNVGSKKPSHVLRAMGRGDLEIRGSLRLSLGRGNNQEDVEPFLAALERAVHQLEAIAPKGLAKL